MKKRSNKEFSLTISHYKILQTINDLNKMQKYPTSKGVNNILGGKIDNETKQYSNLSTYGTLISYPGRKLCSYILNLVRREYLTYIYDKNSDGMYLRITEKGETELFLYTRKSKTKNKGDLAKFKSSGALIHIIKNNENDEK